MRDSREIDKKMFKVINESRALNENKQALNESDVTNPTKSDVTDEQNKFRQNVTTDVKFTEFNILPDAGNVIFRGYIPNLCEWSFEFSDRVGFGFSTQNVITMNDDTIEIIKKMNGYFINWRKEWGEKLIEYQNA